MAAQGVPQRVVRTPPPALAGLPRRSIPSPTSRRGNEPAAATSPATLSLPQRGVVPPSPFGAVGQRSTANPTSVTVGRSASPASTLQTSPRSSGPTRIPASVPPDGVRQGTFGTQPPSVGRRAAPPPAGVQAGARATAVAPEVATATARPTPISARVSRTSGRKVSVPALPPTPQNRQAITPAATSPLPGRAAAAYATTEAQVRDFQMRPPAVPERPLRESDVR